MNITSILCNIPSEVAEKLPTVTMPGTEEGTYAVAQFIMHIVNWIFDFFVLSHHPTLELWIYTDVLFAI